MTVVDPWQTQLELDYKRKKKEKYLYQERLRMKVLYAYSVDDKIQGACCGEKKICLMTIDHINGGGNKHRKSLGIEAGIQFYAWLNRNHFPKGFQILCQKCNKR